MAASTVAPSLQVVVGAAFTLAFAFFDPNSQTDLFCVVVVMKFLPSIYY